MQLLTRLADGGSRGGGSSPLNTRRHHSHRLQVRVLPDGRWLLVTMFCDKPLLDLGREAPEVPDASYECGACMPAYLFTEEFVLAAAARNPLPNSKTLIFSFGCVDEHEVRSPNYAALLRRTGNSRNPPQEERLVWLRFRF